MDLYCAAALKNPALQHHHDNLHGVPVDDDNILFEYYCLEIAQAGLSWQTIMKKHAGMKRAFDNFDVARVANYGEADIARLMVHEDVIKYRLKITSIIHNAQQILKMQKQDSSFTAWLKVIHNELGQELENCGDMPHDEKIIFAKKYWVKQLKTQFKFTGMEIVGEFLMGIAYLPDGHEATCPVFQKIKARYGALPYEDFF